MQFPLKTFWSFSGMRDKLPSMIIDVPNPTDFATAGLSQLYLAWQIAMASLQEFDDALSYGAEDDADTRADYWRRSQPALANAYSLIQQAMELALKGRIAAVSPLLLIGDPADWTGRAATEEVSFGEFRTLDAADLVKVHNSIATPALDDAFKTFWEEVRRERNKVMHSTNPKAFAPADVVRAILTAALALFAEKRWPTHLLEMEEEGRLAALGFNDNVQNNVMRQVELALAHLKPPEALRFLGFNTKSRAYICPHCYFTANRDWQEVWQHLAQFKTKTKGATDLACIVCETVTTVDRTPCQQADCKGDVMAEEVCLTCTAPQGYVEPLPLYEFILSRSEADGAATGEPGLERCRDDKFAKDFGRDMLDFTNLGIWNKVSISQVMAADKETESHRKPIGSWTGSASGLQWHQDEPTDAAPPPEIEQE